MEAIFALLLVSFFYLIYCVFQSQGQAAAKTRKRLRHRRSYPFIQVKGDPKLPHVRSIHTKIRGVTFSNSDGGNRQNIIRECCQSGDALFFAREPNNPFDCNAIQVRRIVHSDDRNTSQLGEQLGYLSRELAEELAPQMDERRSVLMGSIMNVTGGEDGRNFGVNIQIEEYARESASTLAKKSLSKSKLEITD